MQRAGIVLGPRTWSSGEIVYGARSPGIYALIDSYADALGHVRRLRQEGAHSIKNYNQPRRNQRQQVAAAARAENLLVVPEGGSLFQMDITLIQDGNSTIEHNIPQRRLYDDVLGPLGAAHRSPTTRPWSSPMAASPAIPIGARRPRSGTIRC